MSALEQVFPDETDCLLYALEPVLRKFRDSRERRQARELLKAVRLAPHVSICEALLRGEGVPLSKLDPRWVRAYGLPR